MPSEPDLTRDMDALFSHMKDNLEWDPEDPLEWHFTFRSADPVELKSFGESLEDEFSLHFQETVETIEDGRTFDGPPILSVVMSGVFTLETIKTNHDRFTKLAAENHLDYEGVGCYESFDEEDLFDWLNLEDATWRLRVFTDTGLKPGDAVPYVFAVEPSEQTVVEQLVTEIETSRIGSAEHLSDDQGEVVVVHIQGSNDDSVLEEAFGKVGSVADKHRADLLGVQFMELEPELED